MCKEAKYCPRKKEKEIYEQVQVEPEKIYEILDAWKTLDIQEKISEAEILQYFVVFTFLLF